jgi:hypothetical protein
MVGAETHLFSVKRFSRLRTDHLDNGADIHTDRSLTMLCPIIFPQSALVFALTEGLGS